MRIDRRSLLGFVPPLAIGARTGWSQADRNPLTGDEARTATIPSTLALVPASARDDADVEVIVEVADLQRELDHTGAARPSSLTDEDDPARESFLDAVASVAGTGGTVFQFALVPEWREYHGFDLLDVEQVAEFGVSPDRVTVIEGRFEIDAIRDALSAQGYESLDVDGAEVMNVGPDYDLDLDHPITQLWGGRNQNVALLDDRHLVFAPAVALIERVVRVTRGDDDALASDTDVAALLPGPEAPLASALVVDGAALAADQIADGELPVDGDDAPFLPRVVAAVFGSTAGGFVQGPDEADATSAGYPIGENQVRLLFVDAGAAVEAAVAIEARVASGSSALVGVPWSDLLGEVVIERDEASPLVVVRLPDWIPGQRRTTDLLYRRDVSFLLWD